MAVAGNVKSLFSLAPVLPRKIAFIQHIARRKHKDYFALTCGNNFLQVFEGDKVVVIFRLPGDVVSCCSIQYGGNRCLFVVTTDGKLWLVPLNLKKIKSSLSAKTTGPQTNTSATNHDIFSDLLHTKSTTSSTTTQEFTLRVPSTPVILVTENDQVFHEPGLCLVQPQGGNLLACGMTQQHVWLSLWSGVGTDQTLPQYLKSAVWRISFQNSLPPQYFNIQTELILPQSTLTADGSSTYNHTACLPVLVQVQSCLTTLETKHCYTIDHAFYIALFGTELALLDQTVSFIATPSGKVCYISNVNVDSHEGTSSSHLGIKACYVQHLIRNVLYHINQSVESIYISCKPVQKSSKNKTEDELSHTNNSLIIVGGLNKLVLITMSDEKLVFRDYSIPGPVTCSCFYPNENILLYSNTREVYVIRLFDLASSAKETLCGNDVYGLKIDLSPACLMIPDVVALSVKPTTDILAKEATQVEVIAMTLSGNVMIIPVSLGKNNSPIAVSLPICTGDTVRELLMDIEKVSGQFDEISSAMNNQEALLKEINFATNVAIDLHNHSTDTNNNSPPFECIVQPQVHSHTALEQDKVSIVCKFVNNSSRMLSHFWSLVVVVQGKQKWFSSRSIDSQTTHSWSLAGLLQDDTRTAIVPVDELIDFLLPVKITCLLHFDLKNVLTNDASMEELAGVSLVISIAKLDIFDFLLPMPLSPSNIHYINAVPNVRCMMPAYELLRTVDSLFGNRTQFERTSSSSSSIRLTHQSFNSIEIQLSSDMMAFISSSLSMDHDVKNVLLFLTAKCPGLRDFLVSGSGTELKAITPCGVQVGMFTKSGAKKGSVDDGVVLVLEAESPAVLCVLHASIITRLKCCYGNKRKMENNSSGQLKNALAKLQKLQNCLHEFQDDLGSEGVSQAPSEEQTSKLLSLYKDLRQILMVVP